MARENIKHRIRKLKRIEVFGFTLTIVGLVIKLFVFDTFNEEQVRAEHYFDSYHKKEISLHLNEIRNKVDSQYIVNESRGYGILANIAFQRTEYYLKGVGIEKNKMNKIISELQKKGTVVKDRISYNWFKRECDSFIGQFENVVYEKFERNDIWLGLLNKIIAIMTISAAILALYAKWKLIKIE